MMNLQELVDHMNARVGGALINHVYDEMKYFRDEDFSDEDDSYRVFFQDSGFDGAFEHAWSDYLDHGKFNHETMKVDFVPEQDNSAESHRIDRNYGVSTNNPASESVVIPVKA
jgi:hypothetical protein